MQIKAYVSCLCKVIRITANNVSGSTQPEGQGTTTKETGRAKADSSRKKQKKS